jgi:hypothetical protein
MRSTLVFRAGTLRAVVVRETGRRAVDFAVALFAVDFALTGADFRVAGFAAAAREVGFFFVVDFAVAMRRSFCWMRA